MRGLAVGTVQNGWNSHGEQGARSQQQVALTTCPSTCHHLGGRGLSRFETFEGQGAHHPRAAQGPVALFSSPLRIF